MEGTINVSPGDILQVELEDGQWEDVWTLKNEKDLSDALSILRMKNPISNYRIYRRNWDRKDRVGSERASLPVTPELARESAGWSIYWDHNSESLPWNIR